MENNFVLITEFGSRQRDSIFLLSFVLEKVIKKTKCSTRSMASTWTKYSLNLKLGMVEDMGIVDDDGDDDDGYGPITFLCCRLI